MNKTVKQMTFVGPTTTFNFNIIKILVILQRIIEGT